MEKKITRLGISTFLLAAIIYLFGMFGGLVVTTLAVGYVLLFEKDEWLRSSALKALLITLLFTLVDQIIGFIPQSIGLLSNFLGIFGGRFSIPFISRLITFVDSALVYLRFILYVLLFFMALSGKTISVPFIDDLINNNKGVKNEE